MARQLGDVLHYFVPELEPGGKEARPSPRGRLLSIPIGELDVLRAALVWNLAVELARQGARAAVVTPAHAAADALWPEPGRGPLGVELHPVAAAGLPELARVAAALGGSETTLPASPFVLVPLPVGWLHEAGQKGDALLEWMLVLARPEERELLEAYATLKRVSNARPDARLGVSIYGAQSVGEAERSFGLLAGAAGRHLGCPLVSYGLLVDDVHLCRSIVTRRPIGVSHPRSPAARALADVARLLRGDAEQACDA